VGGYFLAFEGRETLDDNLCNGFHFGRDILFPKVEVHFTFLFFLTGWTGYSSKLKAESSKLKADN
jgi:hypothetical protein